MDRVGAAGCGAAACARYGRQEGKNVKKIGKPLGTAVAALMAVMVLAGQAWAVYNGDGTKPNGTTGGWDITDYGKCFSGVKADGTVVIDAAHNLSRPDCIDHVLGVDAAALPLITTDDDYDTEAECIAYSGRVGNPTDDLSHFWVTNTCVDPLTGAGINLDGLDRTATNCALKGGVRVSACTGAWTYTGPADDGAPGFCYTTVNLSTLYTTQASCPTSTVGYTWTSPKCTYSYGIAGYANANIVKKDKTGNSTAAGAFVDLSALTQGQCIAAGASWSTGTTKSGTTAAATTPNPSVLATVTGTRAGCLECHNSVSQYNTYAERWKEPYRNTGHKNMLRKVTPGNSWAGPDGALYTVDASGHTIDFGAGTVDIGGVDKPLMYIFGDWMAPLPNLIYDDTGLGAAKTDSGGSYSCAACHTTGFSNPAAGVCYPDSTKTTSATCLAPNTWVPTTGAQGAAYTPAEPLASFPGYTSGITGKWDRDGIMCSRCHMSVFAQTGTNANGQPFAGPAGTSTHNVTPTNTNAEQITNICFGCHQSPATTYVAATINGVTYPANAKILDPTMIPTGASHGSLPGREFNGHVLGNMFLNSPHARYTGSLVPNALGKYSLATNTPANYSSQFKGMVCRSSTTLGGGSQLETVWKSGAIEEIASLADCNLANGFGTEAAPDGTSRGYWQAESQGNCATCHNVHVSLFDPAATEPLRRECGVTCHADKVDWSTIKHPMGPGTPIGDGTSPTVPCEICHMPKPTAEGFPMHLWRINTDAAYDTFPTAAEFNGTAPAVKDRRAKTAPDGAYTQAVWVDLDLACGQCHGGSAGAAATKNGAPYYDKGYLSVLAAGMHASVQLPPTASYTGLTTTNLVVSFTDNSRDNNGKAASTLAVTVKWGDGKISTGVGGGVFTHTYATGGKFNILHTVKDTGNRYASQFITVTPSAAPVTVNRSLSVKVYRTDGTTPVAQATVYLKKETAPGSNLYSQIAYNYTSASGQLTFANLAPATKYKVFVHKSIVDFNGALAGKQSMAISSAILLNLDSTVTFTQGTPATPADGTNGTAPTIVTTSP